MSQPEPQPIGEDEVQSRLGSYNDDEVTAQLYDFGRMMLQDATDRMAKWDSKGTAIVAYSGAVITVLVSTQAIWSRQLDTVAVWLLLASGVAAAIAGFAAVHSLFLQPTEWFTTNAWIQKECLSDVQKLKKYHISTMWKVIESHHEKGRVKIKRLRRAQWGIAIALLLVLDAFLEVAARRASF